MLYWLLFPCWLVGILFIYSSLASLCLFLLCWNNSSVGGLFYVCMVFTFLVKMPMFMVHLWLPRAHVEAPVSGSIILAGVKLKLGGYGLLYVFPVLFKFCFRVGVVWVTLSLVGGLYYNIKLILYYNIILWDRHLCGPSLTETSLCGAWLILVFDTYFEITISLYVQQMHLESSRDVYVYVCT